MFEKIIAQQFPRLLTQVCRDPNDSSYGCFDRNWWHYRIRDFASIMLQQGGYTLSQYAKLQTYDIYSEQLEDLTRASALFWNKRAGKRGAFEEYYPWERGYPPLAFSTLAMAKLVLDGIVDAEEVLVGLKKAARQLQQRFEYQAGNQQVAGLAALAMIRKINPGMVSDKKYLALKQRTLSLQHEEGWYSEYDGPDLGYLSVTLDCLWDLFDVTDDRDYLISAEKALDFLYGIIARRNGGIGMQNARNTDYIVPYGICRFMDFREHDHGKKASFLLEILFDDLDHPDHFFHAIDDRYWSHYIGHSVVRAQLLLEDKKIQYSKLKEPGMPYAYDGCGYIFMPLNQKNRLMVSGNKGGIFTLFGEDSNQVSDYGWVIQAGDKHFVNHWWSGEWNWQATGSVIEISGKLFPHSEKVSKPFLHFGLRFVSFLFGSALTGMLRNILIFKSGSSGISYVRKIAIGPSDITVTDNIKGINKKANLVRAPRSSKRHVASADSWSREDFRLNWSDEPMETIVRDKNSAIITTIYSLTNKG